MPPFPILPHLSSLFVLRSSRQPSNLPPGLTGITTLRHCPPPLPAAVTPQTDQWIHSSFFIFVLQLCHFKKTSNTLFSILVSELFTLLKHLLRSVIVAAVLAASRVATAKTEHEIHQTWTWCNPATGLVYFPLDSENSMYRCYCFTFIGL